MSFCTIVLYIHVHRRMKPSLRGAEILRSLTWYTLLLMSCLQQSHVQFPDSNFWKATYRLGQNYRDTWHFVSSLTLALNFSLPKPNVFRISFFMDCAIVSM